MQQNFRPFTIDERYFREPVKIHVPYSAPPEALPAAAVPPGSPPPPIDLSQGQFPENDFGGKASKFLKEYGPALVVASIIIIAVVVVVNIESAQNKSDKSSEPVARAISAVEKALADNAKNGGSAKNAGKEENK